MPEDQELEDRLNSIEDRLGRLERSRPGSVSGGDEEFFGHYSRQALLERVLVTLVQEVEKFHPGVLQQVVRRCREAKSAEAAKLETLAESIFGTDSHQN
jgi:hypothetical protein